MTLLRLFACLFCLLSPMAAQASTPLNVVATTTNIGVLAQTVGGEHIAVTVLAPPGRDAHHLQVRPSMMAALRRADLIVAAGAELETGWLPPAIRGAGNPRIQPGRSGYFEAARDLELLDAGRPADRALGDVHPEGNPHFYLDPVRMTQAAAALAEHLTGLRPADADAFRANAAAFANEVERRLPGWQARAASAPGVLLFHDDGRYLAGRFGIPVLGTLEPLPGIPPSAAHLNTLVHELAGRDGLILRAPYHPAQGAGFIARALDWPVREVPHDVPAGRLDSDAWFALIDAWIDAISGDGDR